MWFGWRKTISIFVVMIAAIHPHANLLAHEQGERVELDCQLAPLGQINGEGVSFVVNNWNVRPLIPRSFVEGHVPSGQVYQNQFAFSVIVNGEIFQGTGPIEVDRTGSKIKIGKLMGVVHRQGPPVVSYEMGDCYLID